MRLAKFLANAGVASRRAAEEIVRAGRVTVDGAVVTDPATPVPEDSGGVRVDGSAVALSGATVAYVVNKPAGVVSTAQDPQGRPTVVSLVPSTRRLYPVGRLDADSTGLILLTDDGALAHRLTHPSFGVEKTYRATVARAPVREPALRELRAGIELDDGLTAPARAKRIAPDKIELTLREGRKRQVRRMCEAVGHPVLALERVRLGPLRLGDLAPGAHRRLSASEIDLLRSAGTAPGSGLRTSGRAARPAAASSSAATGRSPQASRSAAAPRRAAGS